MITPITQESEWRQFLDDLPIWMPPERPTIVISPHPDDETLGAGGLICALTEVKLDVSVIAVTDGENAYEGETALGPIREAEQTDALALLGVAAQKIHRLRMPDSRLCDVEKELVGKLLSQVHQGTHIVAPWTGDFHPDHEVCGRAARTVADATGAELTFYFFWTWHRGTPTMFDGLDLHSLPLSPQVVQKKKNALKCHQSQLEHISGWPILPPNLLEPMQRNYEVFLQA